MEQALFSDKQAAAYLSISRRHFWNLIEAGRISKGIKVSQRCTRWRISELEKFIEDLEAKAA